MKPIRLFLILASLFSVVLTATANDAATIRGILISAANTPGAADRRLAPFEPTLRRMLPYKSYRFIGDGTATVKVAAQGTISLGDGHQLALTTEKADGKTVQVKVRWQRGGRTLMNTGLTLVEGVPAVIGGPSTGQDKEVYAVILIAR